MLEIWKMLESLQYMRFVEDLVNDGNITICKEFYMVISGRSCIDTNISVFPLICGFLSLIRVASTSFRSSVPLVCFSMCTVTVKGLPT